MKILPTAMNLHSNRDLLARVRRFLGVAICLGFLPAFMSCAGAGSSMQTTPPSPPKQHTVTLSWYANYPPVAGYNIYRGTTHGGPYSSHLNSSLQASTMFNDATVQNGTTYFYVVTAVNAQNEESSYSAEVEVTVPSS